MRSSALKANSVDQQESTPRRGGTADATPAKVDALSVQVYDELRRLAAVYMQGQGPDHILQPTALVHEAYMKLAQREGIRCESRAHFMAIAARAMRQILIDSARAQRAAKRGASWNRITISHLDDNGPRTIDLLALEEALAKLADLNERQCRIAELRFLAGLTVDETAAVLGVSERTVRLDWRMARAWLLQQFT